MIIALALALNAALLAVLLPWLRRQWHWAATAQWRGVLAFGFGLRVLVGLVRNLHPKEDAAFMSGVSDIVTTRLVAAPSTAWTILTQAITVFPKGAAASDFVFQNTSNTWILIKILAVLNFGSLSTSWLNALYLSLFAFVGCWHLVRRLADVLPATPAGAGAVAFLLWPSVWFWSTGISKEAVLLGSGAWLTAQVVAYCYGRPLPPRTQLKWWLGTLALALLHFGMRYFFALPLLGVLAGVGIGQALWRARLLRQRWQQLAVLAAVLAVGVWLAPNAGSAFRLNKFTNQVIKVYSTNLEQSKDKPHFEYPSLRPTVASVAANAPLAVANALTRPWLGESWQPMYVVAACENLVLLVLLGFALGAAIRGRTGHLPLVLALGLVTFCVVLAFLIGLTTPNLGTLNRYRCAFIPFFLLLLLQHDYAAAWLHRLGLRRPPAQEKRPAINPPLPARA